MARKPEEIYGLCDQCVRMARLLVIWSRQQWKIVQYFTIVVKFHKISSHCLRSPWSCADSTVPLYLFCLLWLDITERTSLTMGPFVNKRIRNIVSLLSPWRVFCFSSCICVHQFQNLIYQHCSWPPTQMPNSLTLSPLKLVFIYR